MKKQPLIPPFDEKVHLSEYDPAYTGPYKDDDEIKGELAKDLAKLAKLQTVLYAENKRSLLVILQAIDAGGKDGTIRHVFSGVNPQGVSVTSFKQPTPFELAHDFLWRVHLAAPAKGYIGIFNRSHYEEVLIVRVHKMVPKEIWKPRYEHINRFEELLTESNTTILKFFLYISKDEQKRRFEERLSDPQKYWKFAMGDLRERELWDDYIEAYEAMLSKCNTKHAPWHIVPANHKWYRNLIITKTIVSTLEAMDLQFPPAMDGIENVKIPD